MSAIFVTATGTDIGKTFVTSGLIRTLRAAGTKVGALKPIVSGFDIATAAVSDPGVLLDAMGASVNPEALDRVAPWRFAAPLSPDMAARREGKDIDFNAVVQFSVNGIAQGDGHLLIEGVGGVMVPLDDRHTVLDWMIAAKLPVLLVTGSYLGTISHTLTTCEVLARAGLTLRAIALNDSGDGAVPLSDTRETVQRFVRNVPIVTIPRVKSWLDAKAEFNLLASHLFEE